MIVTRTPLRISFIGGGTDFPDFYEREGGAVVSTTIDKYVFAMVRRRFDDKIHLGYSEVEEVDEIEDLHHGLIREAMKVTQVTHQVEVHTIADVPGQGTGLGSSSAVTVGTLLGLWAYSGTPVPTAEELARQACDIEIGRLGKSMGKQDQYACAVGGLQYIAFQASPDVVCERLPVSDDVLRGFRERLLLYYTGRVRAAESVLKQQKQNIERNRRLLRLMTKLAMWGRDRLLAGDLDGFGHVMHEGWMLKRELAPGIMPDDIQEVYSAARHAGAIAGKITGAGAGGFLLLFCQDGKQEDVRRAVKNLREIPFEFESTGTRILLWDKEKNCRPLTRQ